MADDGNASGDAGSNEPLVSEVTKKLEGEGYTKNLLEVVSGDVVTYALVVTNESNVDATNVMVKDAVPMGLEYVKGSAKVVGRDDIAVDDMDPQTREIVWQVGNLKGAENAGELGESVVVTFQATVPPVTEPTKWLNVGELTYDEGPEEPVPSNEVEIEAVVSGFAFAKKVEAAAGTTIPDDLKSTKFPYDVSLWKTDSTKPDEKSPVGGTFKYTLATTTPKDDGTVEEVVTGPYDIMFNEEGTLDHLVTDDKGSVVLDLTLTDGQTITIYGLPRDTQYEVTERLDKPSSAGTDILEKLGWKVVKPETGWYTDKVELLGLNAKPQDPATPGASTTPGEGADPSDPAADPVTPDGPAIMPLAQQFTVKEFTNTLVPQLRLEKWQQIKDKPLPSDVTPGEGDLADFTKDPLHAASDDVVVYRLVVTNTSKVNLDAVMVTDDIPTGTPPLEYVPDSARVVGAPDGMAADSVSLTYKNPEDPAEGVAGITWNVGALDAGASKTVAFEAKVPTVAEPITWTNVGKATYKDNPEEPTPSNEVKVDADIVGFAFTKQAVRTDELAPTEAQLATKFPFLVELWNEEKGPDGTPTPAAQTGTYKYVVVDADGTVGQPQPMEFANAPENATVGAATCELAPGESLRVYGLPEGTHYRVSEEALDPATFPGWQPVAPAGGSVEGEAQPAVFEDAAPTVPVFAAVHEFTNALPALAIEKWQKVEPSSEFTQQTQTVTSADVVTYRLVVTNPSQVVARGVKVVDYVPNQNPRLTYVADSAAIEDADKLELPENPIELIKDGADPDNPEAGTVTGITWNLGDLEPGGSRAVTFKVKVPSVTEACRWVNQGSTTYENNPDGPEEPIESNEVVIEGKPGTPELEIHKYQAAADGADNTALTYTQEVLPDLKPGTQVAYMLEVTNTSATDALDVKATDKVPLASKGEGQPPLSYVDGSASDGGQYDEASKTITWDLGTLPAGESRTLYFRVQVPQVTQDTEWTNVATLTAKDVPDKPSEEVKVESPVPQLKIEKWQKVKDKTASAPLDPDGFTQQTETVTSADEVIYKLVVTNDSKVTAEGVVVRDTVPEEEPLLSYIERSAAIVGVDNPAEGAIVVTGEPVPTIEWHVGDIEPGQSRSVTFRVKVPSITHQSTWTNQGSTTYTNNPEGPDTPIPSNKVVIEGQPGEPKLEIHKSQAVLDGVPEGEPIDYTREPLVAEANSTLVYQLQVSNDSDTDALGVVVTDKIPVTEGVSLVYVADSAMSDNGVAGVEQGGTITWSLGTLPAHGTRVMTFKVQVPTVTQDTAWTNVATVTSSNTPDTPPSEEVKVESPVPQLLIEKLHRVGAESEFTKDLLHVERDSVVTYQLVVTHDPADPKPADAKGLHVTDVVPTAPSGAPYGYVPDSLWGAVGDGAGATVEGRAVSVAYDEASRTVSCDADLLLPGEKLIISFDVRVPAVKEYTQWTNVGYLSYDNNPEGPGEEQPSNPVEEETDVPNVVIKKLQSTPDQHDGKPVDVLLHVPAGAEVTYHVTVTNDPKRPESTQAATGVVVTDHVPDGLELVEVLDDGAYDAETGNITWNVGDLAARESKTVRFTVKVPQVPAYTKWVNTASTHYDNNPDNPDDPEKPKPEKPSNEVEVDTDVTGLLVSKTAVVPEGVADDGSAAFAFDVTVVAPDGKPVAGGYFMARAAEKDEAGAWVFGEPEPVQFADGRPVLADSAPLTLRNLEAVRFIGLPEKATYQVVETPADGWTQTKVENAEGSLTTGATVEAAFTNTKDYGPAHLAIDGSKVMTGRPFAAGAFTFVLAPGNDQTQKAVEEGAVVLPESLETTNGDPVQFEDGSAAWSAPWAFGEIVFNRAGDYDFKVTERVPAGAENGRPVNGVRYDTVTRVVGVNVSPGTEGSLVATKKLVNATEADAPIVFTNAYAGDRVMVPITGVKVLEGRELQAGEFTFQLVSGEGENERVIAVTNNGQGIFAFPANALTYTVADLADVAPAADGTRTKEFFYVVRELVPDDKYALPGVTYDPARYLVKVTLTDNGQGVLSAVPTVTLEGAEGAVDSMVFSNVYAHQGAAEAVLQVGKVLTGRPINSNEFSFTAVDLATGRVAATGIAPATADGTPVSVSLEKITYDAASMADAEQYEDGTRGKAFTYEIAENVGNLPLVTYDRTRYYARVWVVDDGLGQMTASAPAYFWDMACEQPVEGNWPVFRNAYDAPKASYTPEAYKSTWGPEGADLTGLSFGFEVTDNNGSDAQGSVVARGMANANGPVVFDKALEFSAAGTYHYVLTERNNGAPSVTYDTAAYLLDVTVGFNEAGGLAVTEAVYRNVDGTELVDEWGNRLAPVFQNSFSGKGTFLNLRAHKQLVDGNGNPLALKPGAFSFSVIDEATGERVSWGVNDAAGNVSFRTIVYSYDNIVPEPAVVEEPVEVVEPVEPAAPVEPEQPGESTGPIDPGVPVEPAPGPDPEQPGDPGVPGEPTVPEQPGEPEGPVEPEGPAEPLEPEAPSEEQGGSEGADAPEGLEGGEGLIEALLAPEVAVADDAGAMPYVSEAVPAAPVLTSSALGKHSYLIMEDVPLGAYQNPDGSWTYNGVTYERDVYRVVVDVHENDQKNALVATIERIDRLEDGDSDRAVPVTMEGFDGMDHVVFENVERPAEPPVVKLEGTKTLTGRAMEAEEFGFEVLDAAGERVAAGVSGAAADGQPSQIAFAEFAVPAKPGTYVYTVREVSEGQEIAGVTFSTQVFTVQVTVAANPDGTLSSTVAYPDGPVAFVNTYTPEGPAEVKLEGTKTLVGRAMEANEFSFAVYDVASGKMLAGGASGAAANGEAAAIDFATIAFTQAGEYDLVVVETPPFGSTAGVAYDGARFGVHVSVTDAGAGKLAAAVSYPDGPVAFKNTYQAAPVEVVLGATKTLEGRELTHGAFRFTVTDANGALAAEGVNLADGSVAFGALRFESAGTYTYTIAEVVGTEAGMTYDRRAYTAVVDVTDDGEGNLLASVTYPDGSPVFANRYEKPEEPPTPDKPTPGTPDTPTPGKPGTPGSNVPQTGDGTPGWTAPLAAIGGALVALAGAVLAWLRLRTRVGAR